MKNKIIAKLQVQCCKAREDVVKALAASGYPVVVKEVSSHHTMTSGDFYVVVYEKDEECQS